MTPFWAPWGGARAGGDGASTDDAERWPSLVHRIEQADSEAEAELAREFHPRVLMFASVRLHGSDAAQDIAQEAMAAALRALRAGTLREPAKLPGFIMGIARNLINKHYRLEAKNRVLAEAVAVLPERLAPADAGAGATVDEDRRALVREAMTSLKTVDRRILTLTLVEGMSPREIAPIVGLAPESVRTRKTRAVRASADRVERLTRQRRRDHLQTSALKR